MLIHWLFAALALSGVWLAGPARMRMDGWTTTVVLIHLGLGLIAAPVFAVSAFRQRRAGSGIPLTSLFWLTCAFLSVTLMAGVGLIGTAAQGDVAPEPLFWLHVTAGCVSGVVGLVHLRYGQIVVDGPEERRAPAW